MKRRTMKIKTVFLKRLNTLAIAFAASVGLLKAETITVSDSDIDGDVKWTSDNEYVLSGFLYVEDVERLTIEAGTVVLASTSKVITIASFTDTPDTYTRMGTPRTDPPPPTSPRVNPSKRPRKTSNPIGISFLDRTPYRSTFCSRACGQETSPSRRYPLCRRTLDLHRQRLKYRIKRD